MIWGGISYAEKLPLVFFDNDQRLTAAAYKEKILIQTVLPFANHVLQPWLMANFGRDLFGRNSKKNFFFIFKLCFFAAPCI